MADKQIKFIDLLEKYPKFFELIRKSKSEEELSAVLEKRGIKLSSEHIKTIIDMCQQKSLNTIEDLNNACGGSIVVTVVDNFGSIGGNVEAYATCLSENTSKIDNKTIKIL
ncbi:MAG: hypothetical protein LBJ95_03465 [Oscillospiraceae bacterium]|jgi:hypothetical protein|nr:hypothetical protein [Oscillospiraceae bacterium]